MTGRVLVVDDKHENHVVIEAILVDAGFTVVSAMNGEQMVAALDTHVFDMVLMDVMLAGEDGYLLTRRIHQMPGLALLPVIFISALDNTQDRVRGYDSGGLGYIPRMTDVEEVVAVVRRFVAYGQAIRDI